jgi:hypothetical protein
LRGLQPNRLNAFEIIKAYYIINSVPARSLRSEIIKLVRKNLYVGYTDDRSCKFIPYTIYFFTPFDLGGQAIILRSLMA